MTKTWFVRSALIAALGLAGFNCGGGASLDKVDPAALKEGASHTLTLKYWMKGSGADGDAIVDNLHFDDGANKRVVFLIGDAVKAKVASLEQNKTYKVTFTHKGGDELFYGTATAIE